MVLSLIVILLLGTVDGSNGQCDGQEINITSGNGEISSPNNPNEYGRVANCSWKFPPSEGQALVLTIVYQRLYILETTSKLCLESYVLSINNDIQDCSRYIDDNHRNTLIGPLQYFDSMCSSVTENPPYQSVRVQYISDGRRYNGSNLITTVSMGFRIQYKFSKCPMTEETTTGHVTTNVLRDTSYERASTILDNYHALLTTEVDTFSTIPTMSTTEATHKPDSVNSTVGMKTTKSNPTEIGNALDYFTTDPRSNTTKNNTQESRETDGPSADGISDTAKLFLVSIPGFIGIIILVVTAIVFCRKRGDKSQGNKVGQENVGSNQMENVEPSFQEQEQDNATGDDSSTSVARETESAKNTNEAAEHDGPTTSTIQEEESPYTIMYSALAQKDQEDEKKTSASEEDEHKYDMYSAVVRKTEGGDKESIHV